MEGKTKGDIDEMWRLRWIIYYTSYIVEKRAKSFDDSYYQICQRVFLDLNQCIKGFNYCKPIIQVDGIHLYMKYHSALLIATTQDGKDCVFPFAFDVVEGKTLKT